jgi:hypothetical protein
MAFVVKDRVKQSTTTTGTGSIVLNGTVSGFQTFTNALSDGDTTYYAIFEVSTNEWEVGVGTWTESTTTLARTTVLASSNSNSAIDLSAQAEVFITQPAGKAAFFDPSGDLTLVQDPTSNLQAATKQYVDTIAAAGLHYHDPVRVEQEGNLSATYSNGTAGVGATLTNNSTQAALTIDGVALSLNDRVLIYEQTNGYENGVYTVTNVGSASTNWVLTRATDADSYGPSDPDSLGQGDAFFVLEGTEGAGELYVMNTEGTITFGTTNITFTQVAATAVYTAGTGLTLTGTEFAADGANITNVDAVTLDGIDSSQFLRSDTVDTKTAGNLNFSDTVKAQFGDSSDLQIYHDGTRSYIDENGTGDLWFRAENMFLRNMSNKNYLKGTSNAQVELFYNGVIKLATTSTGVDITGTLTSDDLTVNGDVKLTDISPAIILSESDTTDVNTRLGNYGGDFSITTVNDSDVYVANRLTVDHATGDISFYEDTGTTAKFFWDASAESLGIGTSAINGTLDIANSDQTNGVTLSLTNSFVGSDWTAGDTIGTINFRTDDASTTEPIRGQIKVFDDATVSGTYPFNNAMSFSTGYTNTLYERMRIDSSGSLLVGTTVNDGQSIGAGSQDGTVIAGTSQYIQRGDNANLWLSKPSGATNTDFIKFYNNSSLVGQIECSGTTLEIMAQSTNFHLQTNGGTSNANNNLWSQANIKPWNDNYFDLGVSNYRWKDLYLSNAIYLGQPSGNTTSYISDYQDDLYIFNKEAAGVMIFGTANTERMRIDSSGNVGIGTSTPNTALEIKRTSGTANLRLHADHVATPRAAIEFMRGTTDTFGGDTYTDWKLGQVGSTQADFAIISHDTTRGANERLTLEYDTGNVGIGTSSPSYKLEVAGSFAATTKSFVIDHPTKEGMKLRHGSLEGPEDGVYVRGRLTGETVIELPDYWTGLVHEDSITVQLTAMGGKADLWVESIADNKVTVGCDTEVDCFYFVQATRKDVDAWDVEYVADS